MIENIALTSTKMYVKFKNLMKFLVALIMYINNVYEKCFQNYALTKEYYHQFLRKKLSFRTICNSALFDAQYLTFMPRYYINLLFINMCYL